MEFDREGGSDNPAEGCSLTAWPVSGSVVQRQGRGLQPEIADPRGGSMRLNARGWVAVVGWLLVGPDAWAVERDGRWIVNDWPAAQAEARAGATAGTNGKPIFAVFRCQH